VIKGFCEDCTLQVHKHNKRYVLATKIVRSIFTEQPLGQVVARFLRGDSSNSTPKEFHKSPLFGRQAHCHHLHVWLETVAADLPAPSIEGSLNVINAIADGIDIRATGPRSKETMDFAMSAHAAHPSTQRNTTMREPSKKEPSCNQLASPASGLTCSQSHPTVLLAQRTTPTLTMIAPAKAKNRTMIVPQTVTTTMTFHPMMRKAPLVGNKGVPPVPRKSELFSPLSTILRHTSNKKKVV
jgi:hypothetical protein